MLGRMAAIVVTMARPWASALGAELEAWARQAAGRDQLAVVREQNDSEGILTPAGRARWN